jgi:uncharacterized protein with von Willebrand factor type A (vWA) domain
MNSFDIQDLDKKYGFIDALSDELFAQVLDQDTGTLMERTTAVDILRTHLVKGVLPTAGEMPWPVERLRSLLLDFLRDLNIAPLCEAQPELVEVLIASLLDAIRDYDSQLDLAIDERFRELVRVEEQRLAEERAKSEEKGDTAELPEPIELAEEDLEKLREQAHAEAPARAQQALLARLSDQWKERVEMWHEVFDVFGQLTGLLGRGWDYARGLLQSQSWLEVAKLRELMEKLPELRELIRTLGRMHVSDDDEDPVMETIFATVRRAEERWEDKPTPLAPTETRGIRRSNDLSRLLPGEALNFAHPRLRTLFYARMYEHALATYLVEGVMPQRIEDELDIEEEQERPGESPPKKRGPIIACLDTSGSMAGRPEHIAKALVLEALRVAHEEDRPCYLIAFSGPDQTEAQELSLTPDGFQTLFGFLSRSFHGGTDLVAPIREASNLLGEERWEKADILLVSDGEFSVPREITSAIDDAREEQGLRLHGVCVGRHRHNAMRRICDEFHLFDEWEALA